MKILIWLGLVLSSGSINGESCSGMSSCNKCIGNAIERCSWCAQETMMNGMGRCQPESIQEESWCPQEFRQNPDSGIPYLIEDEPFSSEVTIRPQVLNIRLRPGLAVPFTISYEPGQNSSRKLNLRMDYVPWQLSARLNVSEYIELKTNCDSRFCDEQNATVHLLAHIKAKKCIFMPLNVIITPKGLSRGLRINIKIDCDCNCSDEKFFKKRINNLCDKCNTFENYEFKDQCKNSNEYCSGHGECVCGECFCEPGYSGNICEKEDEECPKTCPSDRFPHTRSKRACHPSKESETDSSCSSTEKACIGPFSNLKKQVQCNGRGKCVGGKCKCNPHKGGFGDFCEDILHYCNELGDYAACNFDTWITDNHTLHMLKCDVDHNIDIVKSIRMVDKTKFISKEGSKKGDKTKFISKEGKLSTKKGTKMAVTDDSTCYRLHKGGALIFKYKKVNDKESNLLTLMIQDELDEVQQPVTDSSLTTSGS